LRGGWLHTGDAGLVDNDGHVTMRGRFWELIKVGDVTWSPRDVEDALCEISGVLQASVAGLPDAKLPRYDLAPLIIKIVSGFR
jgi:acyl-CoA synthetase (AMP-forming)/AMP-acid ligase II